jgi:hypothetical protein
MGLPNRKEHFSNASRPFQSSFCKSKHRGQTNARTKLQAITSPSVQILRSLATFHIVQPSGKGWQVWQSSKQRRSGAASFSYSKGLSKCLEPTLLRIFHPVTAICACADGCRIHSYPVFGILSRLGCIERNSDMSTRDILCFARSGDAEAA